MNTNKGTVVVKNKKRILMLADWHQSSTGFGTVTKNIVPYIIKHYGDTALISFIAINYFGEPYTVGNVTVVSAKNYFTPMLEDGVTPAEPDPFGSHALFMTLAGDVKGFDLLFIIQDLSIINRLVPTLEELKLHKQKNNLKNFKSCVYMPVDATLTKKELSNIHFFDTIITYNEFGRNEIVRNRPELRNKTKAIPHGNSAQDFYAIPDDEAIKFRKDYFGSNANKIIFSNINRNQPRKAIGETILAFIEMKKLWTLSLQPFLYLHMLDKDPLMSGYDLKRIFEQTDLVEGVDYMIAPQEYFTKASGADIATLRSIYNATDIFITTTTGEGWSLSVTEAMACRTPVILPLHTSFIEISDNGRRAYGMTNMVPFINQFDHTIRDQVDIYECAEMMVNAAENRVNNSDVSMIDAAEKYVKSLSWRKISEQFLEYFDRLM